MCNYQSSVLELVRIRQIELIVRTRQDALKGGSSQAYESILQSSGISVSAGLLRRGVLLHAHTPTRAKVFRRVINRTRK